jgi:hypothetical protein
VRNNESTGIERSDGRRASQKEEGLQGRDFQSEIPAFDGSVGKHCADETFTAGCCTGRDGAERKGNTIEQDKLIACGDMLKAER